MSPVFCDNHTVIRSDRASGETKGGVMISVPQIMLTSDIHNFSLNCPGILIEAVGTTLLLRNGEHLQITVVYRSPTASTNNLLNAMSAILNQLTSTGLRSVVLGNFNDDLLVRPYVPVWFLSTSANSYY